MSRNAMVVLSTVLSLSLSFIASAADVSTNSGFELAGAGGPADSAFWTEFAGGAVGTMSARDPGSPLSGSWAHHLMAIGDVGIGAVAGINQNSIADGGLASLAPASSLGASFGWKGGYGPGGVGFASLKILNGVGAIVASTGLVALPDTGGVYVPISTPALAVPAFGPAPDDVYAAFLEISVNAGAFTGSTAHGYVDNVYIDGTLVPEPGSLGLLALAALVGGLRRR